MKRAIYIRFLIIIFLTSILSGTVSALLAAAGEERQVQENASMLCRSLTYQYTDHPDAAYLSQVLDGTRVTIIDPDGVVLADSDTDAAAMESHADRREIQNAREGYVATDTRASDTLGHPFMYAATKVEDGNILRIAVPYGGIWSGVFGQLPVFLITFSITALICIFIALGFAKKITRPLESFAQQLSLGEYDQISAAGSYYEIEKITRKIQELLHKIQETEAKSRMEGEKTRYILSNIEEGLILLDDQKNIVIMNQSARSILHADTGFVQGNIVELTRQREFTAAADKAIQENQSTLFDIEIANAIYSVHVSPAKGEYVDSSKNGATILLVNVSAQRLSEKQRSEFFTNASHELKTPITTLMGLSEMLESGALPPERLKQIYSRIHTETVRMGQLIGDILTISRLESGITDDYSETVNIADIAAEVVEGARAQAAASGIRLQLQRENVFVYANNRRIWELLTNLVDNAIKYNQPGGSVEVKIFPQADDAVIQVRDTGIGIPQEDQSRIFERFYRSGAGKAVKGTGLGLAIVKHIVKIYDGTISLESTPGVGTMFQITLPKLEQK